MEGGLRQSLKLPGMSALSALAVAGIDVRFVVASGMSAFGAKCQIAALLVTPEATAAFGATAQ